MQPSQITNPSDWAAEWAPMQALIGQDFAPGELRHGADAVEAGAIRRYAEVLEFDCPLHHDPAAAQACGHAGLLAPATSLSTWTVPAMWPAGSAPVFTSDARDAEPERSPLKGTRPPGMPATSAYMATDFEVDYLLPVRAGDRLARRGYVLLKCDPKETKVGRGAFTQWQYEVVNQQAQVVARCRFGMYHYHPHPSPTQQVPR